MASSHLLGVFLGVRSWGFVQHGGAGLGKLAFFRQGGGLVISSLKVIRIVVWVGGVVGRFRFSPLFLRRSKFLPEGSSGAFEPMLAHPSHIIRGSFAVLLVAPFPSKDGSRKSQEVSPGSSAAV